MGDCLRCIKYLLFVFNLIFCLIGLAILAIGVWVYVKPMTDILPSGSVDGIRYLGVFLLVIGSIITVLGFLGCCGAIFENRCLLVLFFILLMIVFLILLAAGIALLFLKQVLVTGTGELFTTLVYNQNDTAYRNQTDAIQSMWNCCGAAKAEKDYLEQNLPIPESCKPETGKTYVSCSQLAGDFISHSSLRIAITVFVTAVVALLGMIFSMMLCCAITDMA